MRRFFITAATGLAAACLAGGCTASAQQPPAAIGSATRTPVASPSTDVGVVAAVASNVGLSSNQLIAAATAATNKATALHLTGTGFSFGGTVTVDAHLNRNGPSSGTLGYEGASIPFVATGGVDYFQLTPSLMTLEKLTDPAARGMWVTSTSEYGEGVVLLFSSVLTLKSFLSHSFAGSGDVFAYTGLGRLGSQRVATYVERTSTGLRYDYDFPAVGAALPLRVSGGDSDYGKDLDYTWNQPTTPEVPSASEIYTGQR